MHVHVDQMLAKGKNETPDFDHGTGFLPAAKAGLPRPNRLLYRSFPLTCARSQE
jgi:hypothetical protein